MKRWAYFENSSNEACPPKILFAVKYASAAIIEIWYAIDGDVVIVDNLLILKVAFKSRFW